MPPVPTEPGQGSGLCSLPHLGALGRCPDGICSWGEGQGSPVPSSAGVAAAPRWWGSREADESGSWAGAQRNGRWPQHRTYSLGHMVPPGPQVEPCSPPPRGVQFPVCELTVEEMRKYGQRLAGLAHRGTDCIPTVTAVS